MWKLWLILLWICLLKFVPAPTEWSHILQNNNFAALSKQWCLLTWNLIYRNPFPLLCESYDYVNGFLVLWITWFEKPSNWSNYISKWLHSVSWLDFLKERAVLPFKPCILCWCHTIFFPTPNDNSMYYVRYRDSDSVFLFVSSLR